MDHVRVLKRAWQIFWHYRSLWFFGVILSLTVFSWESAIWTQVDNSRSNQGEGIRINLGDQLSIYIPGNGIVIDIDDSNGWSMKVYTDQSWREIHSLRQLVAEIVPPEVVDMMIAMGIGILVFLGILYLINKVAYYVAETSIIQMVGDYEASGAVLTIRQGLRAGWSRTAWRLFLIDLAIILPVAVSLVLLLALVWVPLLLWNSNNTVVSVIGLFTSAGLMFPYLILVILTAVLTNLLLRFIHRACVLQDLSIRDSIQQGFVLAKNHSKDVGLMWLFMTVLRFAWSIVMIPVIILLSPVFLGLVIVGVVIGGIPAALTGLIANLFVHGITPWILSTIVGLPFFFLTLASPLIFLSGLWHTYQSSTWTLTFQTLNGLGSEYSEALPDLAPSTA
jgi:hypothetical protein